MHKNHSRRHPYIWGRIILLVIFASAATVGLVQCLVRAPELSQSGNPASSGLEATSSSVSSAGAASSREPQPVLIRKEQFYTVLLSGIDDAGGGSDTNILVAFDAAGGSIHCISIPRDTGAYIDGSAHKINLASKTSTEKLARTVSELLGIPVDFTIAVDLQGFEALVEAIGGVEFNVPVDMNYDDPVADLHIHFQAGLQHLNGEDALKVVRFRHNNDGTGYGTEDIGRIATQQAFLKAVARQTLTLSNADKIPEFAKIFQQYVDTRLKVGELAWFGTQALSIGTEQIHFATLPGEWSPSRSMYMLDPQATLELVNSSLNPYTQDRCAGDLHIPA